MANVYTTSQLEKASTLKQTYLQHGETVNWRVILDSIGVPQEYREVIRKATYRLEQKNPVKAIVIDDDCDGIVFEEIDEHELKSMKPQAPKEITINTDGTQTSERWTDVYNAEKLKDEKFLLNLHGYDPHVWEIKWAKSTIYQVTLKQEGTKDMYASRITVKKRDEPLFNIEWVKDVFEKFDPTKYEPVCGFAKNADSGSGKVIEINLADVHLGKNQFETIEEQESHFLDVFNDILTKIAIYKKRKVVLVIGQDFLNMNDNVSGSNIQRTAKGTLLEGSTYFEKVYKIGLQLVIYMITELYEKMNVPEIEVIYVKGNHDSTSCFGLITAAEQRFWNCPSITFDTGLDEDRKYRQYGNVGIQYCHGDEEGKNLDRMMGVENPQLFANSTYREVHASHYHKEIYIDSFGIMVRRMSSISPKDRWLKQKGYVGAVRKAQTFVYSDDGLDAILYSYV